VSSLILEGLHSLKNGPEKKLMKMPSIFLEIEVRWLPVANLSVSG